MCEGLPVSYYVSYHEYKARERRALHHYAEFDYEKRMARAERRRRLIGDLARLPRRLWDLGEAAAHAFAGLFRTGARIETRTEARGEAGG